MDLPMASLYVGDLHPDVTDGLLYEKFITVGPILSLKICRDSTTKQSLGYAYVNFVCYTDAEKALDTMNFDTLKGREIRIMWSQRDPSLRHSGVGNIFIKNLDKSIDSKAMYDTFSAFGYILSCKVAVDDEGNSKGYGFVHFMNPDDAKRAIEKVNGMLLNGKKVYVGQFLPRVEREKIKNTFTNIFIKNFSITLTERDLHDLFSKYGRISSCVIMRNSEGTSKRFGFIDFEDHTSAEKAVEEMNNYELDGYTVYVGRAQKKSEREVELKRKFEQMKNDRSSHLRGTNVYIKHLNDTVDDERLQKEFSIFGSVTSAKVMMENGRSKGFGFVCFATTEEANQAIAAMNGRMLDSKPLYVALAQRKEERKAYLNNLCQQRLRYQTITLRTIPSFLMPLAPQGPRFFNHVNQSRSVPRLTVQPPLRLNGSYIPIVLPPNYRPMYNRNNVQPRPITGQQITTRQNSRYTTTNSYRSSNLAASNGDDNKLPLSEQKQMLGEQIYRIIEKTYPEFAGKITGMLLETEITELKGLLSDQSSLRCKMEEAVAVLQAYQENKEISYRD